MSFQIIGDSCCDYPYLQDDYPWLKRVSLTISLGNEEFIDDVNLHCSSLASKMAASIKAPSTACPSPGAFLDAYDCGVDDVYVVTLSDKLSGTYESAVIAANMFKEKYPEKNVFVFSSKSAASAEILICNKLFELASSGMAFDDVAKAGLQIVKDTSTFFVLENLDVLRKNGRLTNLQSVVTSALKLKLVMGADEMGEVAPRGKALSINRAIIKMAELIAENCKGKDCSAKTLYMTQCLCPERGRTAADAIMKLTKFKNCVMLRSGGISTVYANTGGLIVCY